jgi:hypothetical protein
MQPTPKYVNLTDLEATAIQAGKLTQLMRRAKLVDARLVEQVQAEFDAFGGPGTIIFGRESWRIAKATPDHSGGIQVEYRAGGFQNFFGDPYEAQKLVNIAGDKRWRPAHHIPRYAIRVMLEVKELYVHRLLDLRETDAQALGVASQYPGWDYPWCDYELRTLNGVENARESYLSWYRYTHGTTNFRSNDWQIRAVVGTPSHLEPL